MSTRPATPPGARTEGDAEATPANAGPDTGIRRGGRRGARSIELPGISHNSPLPMGARVGRMLHSSGIPGIDPATGQLPPDAPAQAAQAFANMRELLHQGGATLADVVRVTVYIREEAFRPLINPLWLACFPDPHDRPARHILIYEHLRGGMCVQLEVIAECTSED